MIPIKKKRSNTYYSEPHVFGSFITPITIALTSNDILQLKSIVQKFYHKAATFTPPAGWVLIGSGVYIPNEVNIIYAEWSSAGRIEYWITQSV